MKLFKHFLDDLICIFVGSTQKFYTFFDALNKIHPNIKLTLNHTNPTNENLEIRSSCPTPSEIPFLDTACSLEEGKIILDLYKKSTDRNQYLLTSSCHPAHCTTNIPFSLCMRINRICTKPETRDKQMEELKEMLVEREYRPAMIDGVIKKARAIPRARAIKLIAQTKQSTKRPIFVVSFEPRLPDLSAITQKHWRAMGSMDNYLSNVYPEPPPYSL